MDGSSAIPSQGQSRRADLLIKYARLRYVDYDVDYYRFWSNLYNQIGDFARADELMKHAIELAPQSINLHIQRANQQMSRRNYRGAIESGLQAERILIAKGADPVELAHPYTNISESLAQMGNLDSALMYFAKFRDVEKAFVDTSQFIAYRHRLANVLWLQGYKPGAMKLFKEQIRRDSLQITGNGSIGGWGDLTSAYYDLGIIHAFFGREDEAMMCFEQLYKRGIEDWMFEYLRTDMLLKDFRKNPRFMEFYARMEKDNNFRVDALRRAINLNEAGEELRSIVR